MVLDRSVRGRVYAAKMRAEVQALEDEGVLLTGNALSPLLMAKGKPGPAEELGAELLSGADGTALRAAFLKLGYAPEEWAGIATWQGADAGASVGPKLLRRAIVALDPATLVVCDDEAAIAVREAFADDLYGLDGIEDALLAPGRVVHVAGMRVLNLGGFEDALADAHAKQVMWARLKQIPPLGEPY